VTEEKDELTDEEILKALFTGMFGCILVLLIIIVVLALVLIFGG